MTVLVRIRLARQFMADSHTLTNWWANLHMNGWGRRPSDARLPLSFQGFDIRHWNVSECV